MSQATPPEGSAPGDQNEDGACPFEFPREFPRKYHDRRRDCAQASPAAAPDADSAAESEAGKQAAKPENGGDNADQIAGEADSAVLLDDAFEPARGAESPGRRAGRRRRDRQGRPKAQRRGLGRAVQAAPADRGRPVRLDAEHRRVPAQFPDADPARHEAGDPFGARRGARRGGRPGLRRMRQAAPDERQAQAVHPRQRAGLPLPPRRAGASPGQPAGRDRLPPPRTVRQGGSHLLPPANPRAQAGHAAGGGRAPAGRRDGWCSTSRPSIAWTSASWFAGWRRSTARGSRCGRWARGTRRGWWPTTNAAASSAAARAF